MVRRVDTTSMHYKIAQEYMVKFVETDFTEDDKCHKIAQALKMTAEEFKINIHIYWRFKRTQIRMLIV